MPTMESFFGHAEETETIKLGKRKPPPAFFWTGFLNLVGGSLAKNPVYKCITCDAQFQGTTRAAVHLHAREDPHNKIRVCPNIMVGSEVQMDIKKNYELSMKAHKKLPPAPQGPPSNAVGALRYITTKVFPDVDRLFARFIFLCMLPFCIVEKAAFGTWLKHGLGIVYTFPTRKHLSGCLLDQEYAHVSRKVDAMLSEVAFYQMSSDGWSNVRGEAIVSYVLTCNKGDYYLTSTDASLVAKKSAEWCYGDMLRVLEEAKVPWAKISGVITDTEAKMRKLWEIIEDKHPSVFSYGCCTHAIQLIIKAICALPWFESVCARCNQVGKWFRYHHLPAGLLRKYCTLLKLNVSRPVANCKTRFASWIYVVERIFVLKRALRAVVDDNLYKSRCLAKKGRDDDPDDKEPSGVINDTVFWSQVAKFLDIMVPLRVFLRYTDTRFSLACRIYEKFSDISGKIAALPLTDGFTEDLQSKVMDIVTEKWNEVHHVIHAAGYALDPTNIKVDISSNPELWDGFTKVLDRLLSPEEKTEALVEWAKYKLYDGLSGVLMLTNKVTPLAFWTSFCGHFPVLRRVALRILDLRAGTRCVESHFSVMGNIHSKGQARLVNSKVRKLTYIVTNTRMLEQAKKSGFGSEEISKGESESDSDSDYCSDTDEEEAAMLSHELDDAAAI